MVYLCIKEMAKISEDVIIVTSSLTKDMTGKEDQFRAPAIRALCTITDVSSVCTVVSAARHDNKNATCDYRETAFQNWRFQYIFFSHLFCTCICDRHRTTHCALKASKRM